MGVMSEGRGSGKSLRSVLFNQIGPFQYSGPFHVLTVNSHIVSCMHQNSERAHSLRACIEFTYDSEF